MNALAELATRLSRAPDLDAVLEITLRCGNASLLRVTNTVTGSVLFNGGTLAASDFVNQGHVAGVGNTSTLTSSRVRGTRRS